MTEADTIPPILISPSLLSADFTRLGEELRRMEDAGADWLHVDVMDGHFVPNLTIGPPVVKSLARVARRPLDVHLMITDPLRYAEAYAAAGAQVLTFHVEAVADPGPVIERFRALGMKVGLSLNPDIDVRRLEPWLDHVDLVLVMSVFAGFGGQKFMPQVLDKVRWLREEQRFTKHIEIDGGIDGETVALAARAGANAFVSGSYLFGSADPAEAMRRMRAAAEAARVPAEAR
ncbi:MAG: ribulose-phosphate 3-epimerase [Planctomycetes bacterium]|nr:ribulose-phosphate 3-epimerase [Planctomycetota bacterium]